MDAETYSDWNATLDNLHRQMAEQRHEITAYQIAKDNLELRLAQTFNAMNPAAPVEDQLEYVKLQAWTR